MFVFANTWRFQVYFAGKKKSFIKLNVGFISKIKAACSEVTEIRLQGGKGADKLSLCNSLPS